MTNKTQNQLHPRAAFSEIHRIESRVRLSRRWHIGSMLILGVFIIGFFALIGWVPRERIPSYLFALISIVPIMVYLTLRHIRKINPPTSGRKLRNLEMQLGNIFILFLLIAVAIDLLLLEPYQGTVWAGFTGILPALPCFYAVWMVSRK